MKEIAEHIMLVDLGRNDLGRVAEFGSVEIDELTVRRLRVLEQPAQLTAAAATPMPVIRPEPTTP